VTWSRADKAKAFFASTIQRDSFRVKGYFHDQSNRLNKHVTISIVVQAVALRGNALKNRRPSPLERHRGVNSKWLMGH